jgi:hypothetical protein
VSHIQAIFNKAVDSYQQIFLTFDMEKPICNEMFPFTSMGLAGLTLKNQLLDCSQFQMLNNIRRLELSGCDSVRSLEGLGSNITRLSLSYLNFLVDISHIKRMTKLSCLKICRCPVLKDISSVKGIKWLFLYRLKDVIILGPLENHDNVVFFCRSTILEQVQIATNIQTLIIHCDTIRCDLSSLQYLKGALTLGVKATNLLLTMDSFSGTELDLSGFNLKSGQILAKCPRLRSLSLFECSEIDFGIASPFILECKNTLTSISLTACPSVKDITMLSYISEVSVTRCSSIDGVSAENDIKSISIDDVPCMNITSLNSIQRVRISHSEGISDLSELKDVQVLTTVDCINLKSLKGLRNVTTLSIESCINLDDISDLDNNIKSISFIDCPHIKKAYKEGKYEWLKVKDIKFSVY